MDAIKKAIELVGGNHRLAVLVGVKPAFVSQWVTQRRPVPAERCIAIEKAANGQVTRYDLRPDVFGTAPEPQQRVPQQDASMTAERDDW